jgi:predicted glycosyltransferase
MRQLIVTGSGIPSDLPLPPGADYVKLPSVTRAGDEQYVSRALPISYSEIIGLRREILFSTARYFKPDAFIVDHTPPGLKEELVPTLQYLRDTAPDTKLLLGLRDVVGDPQLVRQRWARDGVYGLLEHLYDVILVYGYRNIHDAVAEYDFPPLAARKTSFVGYLPRDPGTRPPELIRSELGVRAERMVLITAGEGEDSYDLFRTALDVARLNVDALPFDLVLVGGPPLSESHRKNLRRLLPSVRFVRYAEDLRSYIAAADVVVSRAGYNTVCEILSMGKPAILVPRMVAGQEEFIRARALHDAGLVDLLHPSDLTPARLLQRLTRVVSEPTDTHPVIALDGLSQVATMIDSMVRPIQPNVGTSSGSHSHLRPVYGVA